MSTLAPMPSVYRVTAVWSGFQGAPGYTKISFMDLTTDALRNGAGAKVRDLFEATKAYRSTGWGVQVQPQVDEFDVGTGALLGSVSMTSAPTNSVGTANPAAHAGGAGFCITWNTSYIYNRRRVRGRTFFVPSFACFDTDGTLSAAAVAAITTAANAFTAATAPRPCVWQRTFNTASPPTQTGGSVTTIDSWTLRDQASQLRSRRL